ncbi:TadE/TadG family type IV pilus assembly protein [Sulfitobacter aestuariivivens]|uniref:Flp pilus-assembly TadG-like N-terminal domain-containing protein n=1 Tax=Sulfitobacter aestuariivivens TaxID=2766981 RepID=A0A927D156_9RHOB|nr:pilus assembly protein TadG-related protein [Sulfitobacter aestuariivivens]MBD3662511.1 hypothetical protein [Sulfitobacter aestuariivivens]
MIIKLVPRAARRFIEKEDGSATILAVLFAMIFLVMGGLAVDFNKVMSERTHLQIAADTAAHAALYTREDEDVSTSKTAAMNTIDGFLPEHQFGANPVTVADVTFGTWDFDLNLFTADSTSNKAVRVYAQMNETRSNPSNTILLSMVGQDTFDVTAESIYSTYYPPCLTEGFVAQEPVDIQSNNNFFNGFCIHSNDYVSLNSNNFFEPGTVVSMPNLDQLDIPNSGFETNEGLQTALRQGEYRMRLLNKLPDMIDSFWSADPKHLPPYISGSSLYDLSNSLSNGPDGKTLDPVDFVPNAVNYLTCSGSGKMTMNAGVYSQMLFVSDCEVKFANGVVLEDVVVATTHTGATSFNTPAGLQIGRNDNCAEGGGATLMTLGGFNAAASLSVYNGQILAIGDIEFAAEANGIQGASFVSYGQIDGTSNMNMGFCNGDGMENAYRAPYFRMVQ